MVAVVTEVRQRPVPVVVLHSALLMLFPVNYFPLLRWGRLLVRRLLARYCLQQAGHPTLSAARVVLERHHRHFAAHSRQRAVRVVLMRVKVDHLPGLFMEMDRPRRIMAGQVLGLA